MAQTDSPTAPGPTTNTTPDIPIHIGSYYRTSYDPDRGVLTYTRLGGYPRYHLLYDHHANAFSIRRETYNSTIGGHARNPKEQVYPTNVDGTRSTAPAATVEQAAHEMVDYLQDNIATFELPQAINGWHKVPDGPAITYRNPGGDAELGIDAASDGTYTATVTGTTLEQTSIATGLETRADAVDALTTFMTETPAEGYGLSLDMSLRSAYAGFERMDAAFNQVARYEHPTGYRLYVVAEDTGDDDTYTVRTSLDDSISRLAPEEVDQWLARFATALDDRVDE